MLLVRHAAPQCIGRAAPRELVRRGGRAEWGVVVEATQLDLERRVALKFLRHATLPETSTALQRFEREARAVARLRGPHVVQVFDVGRLEHGEPFIVMEFLTGEDLKAVLDRDGPLPVTTAVEHIAQTCEAMAEAHVAGVVHRDLKPANLFGAACRWATADQGSELRDFEADERDDQRQPDEWRAGITTLHVARAAELVAEHRLPHRHLVPGRDLVRALDRCERVPRTSSSVEAAVRIIQGSNLQHAGLPQAFDTVPPPGAGAGRARGGTDDTTVASNPSFTVEATSDIGGAETGTTQSTATSSDVTQAEIRPLVAESPSRFGQQSRLRPLTLGAVALVVTGSALFAAQLARGPKESSEATVTSAPPLPPPLGAGTAPAPLPQQPISSVPVVPLPAASALPKPAAAASGVSSAAPAPKSAAPVRKPRPAQRPASDSNDDMLKHR